MLSIGSPSGKNGPAASHSSSRATADQTVVSVGPYMFHTELLRARSARPRSSGRASPPHRTVKSGSHVHPASTSIFHIVGVPCAMVADLIAEASRIGSTATSRSTTMTRAPTVNGRSSSSTEMSNDRVVAAIITSESVRPGRTAMDCRKFTTFRCSTATPFGRPVEPEVKMTYARSRPAGRSTTSGIASFVSGGTSAVTSMTQSPASRPPRSVAAFDDKLSITRGHESTVVRCASSIMISSRSGGKLGSIGT